MWLLAVVCFCCNHVIARDIVRDNLTIAIVHMNDVHAHFDEVDVKSGRCQQRNREEESCFGGMARMFSALKQLREEMENTLVLNAGDYYQGTMWTSKLKYDPVVKFGNLLNWTAMGLGNHEFDEGLEDLAQFSSNVTFDLLACNLVQLENDTKHIKFQASKVVEVDGVQVGIIGYIARDTPRITAPDFPSLAFLDELLSVRKEAQRLKAMVPPVDIIIGLGHAGFQKDLEIAQQVDEIDLVVGGHSHSFLYTGTPDIHMIEEVEGDFPTFVTQSTGRVVPVVQVYKYSKYLGHLKLNFDKSGELMTPVEGVGVSMAEVVTIDKKFPKDPWIESLLNEYCEKLAEFYPTIGFSEVTLNKVEYEESNIGNVITDAMAKHNQWNDTTIALYNNGGIRADIDVGDITGEDVIQVLPFGNTIDRVTMFGRNIKAVFQEFSKHLCADKSCKPATFLQVSGLKVVYDIYPDSARERVTSVKERCGQVWCDLQMEKLYPVVMPSFLAGGGSRLHFFPDLIEDREEGDMVDYTALMEFVKENSPLNVTVEERIVINFHPDNKIQTKDNRIQLHDRGEQTTHENRVQTQDNRVQTQDNRVQTQDNRVQTQDNRIQTQNIIIHPQDSREQTTHDIKVRTQDNMIQIQDKTARIPRESSPSSSPSSNCTLSIVVVTFGLFFTKTLCQIL